MFETIKSKGVIINLTLKPMVNEKTGVVTNYTRIAFSQLREKTEDFVGGSEKESCYILGDVRELLTSYIYKLSDLEFKPKFDDKKNAYKLVITKINNVDIK